MKKASIKSFAVLAALAALSSLPAHAMGKQRPAPAPAPPPAPAPVPAPVPAPPPARPTAETTLQGTTFTRVDSYANMTEAWRDPKGQVWAYNFNEGNVSFNEATQFCQSYGLRLPTEAEFDGLRGEMGFGTSSGYSPQAFILYLQVNYPNGGANYFWSSTYQDSCGVTLFRTENGFTYRGDTGRSTYGVVCVTN